MIKPVQRHSQTLNNKKTKPIQITLTRKNQNIISPKINPANSALFNMNSSHITANVLKEKNGSSSISSAINMKAYINNEERLKQQLCPSYKLSWNTKNQDNLSNRGHQETKYFSNQPSQRQLNHLVRTVDYKKISKEAQQKYGRDHYQIPFQTYEKNLISLQNNAQSMQRTISCMDGTRKKIRGITKSFLRQDKQNKSNKIQQNIKIDVKLQQLDQFLKGALQQKQSSIIVQQSICTALIQPSFIQPFNNIHQSEEFIKYEQKQIQSEIPSLKYRNQKKNLIEFVTREADSLQINDSCTLESTDLLNLVQKKYQHQDLKEKVIQNDQLKTQIARLSQRLENCVQQIDFIEQNNNTDKVLELQHQLQVAKQQNQTMSMHFEQRICQLQRQLKQKDAKLVPKILCSWFVQTNDTYNQGASKQPATQRDQQNQIQRLKVIIRQLNSQLMQQSTLYSSCRSTSFSHHQLRQGFDTQAKLYEIQMQKKRYHTLQQIMQSKKKEIQNKDSIIRVLMTKQLQKIQQNTHIPKDKKPKIKQIVNQLLMVFEQKIKQL